MTWWARKTKSDIDQLKAELTNTQSENWAWAECQLGNRAKRAQQFNLHGEKRKSGGKKREKREGKEKRKGGHGKEDKKRERKE